MTVTTEQLPAPTLSVQGTLALDFGHRLRSSRGPDLRLVPGERLELEGFCHRFAKAIVEVMGGDRGPSQLLRWTSEGVYADLCRRVSLLHRTTPNDRRVRRLRSQVQHHVRLEGAHCVIQLRVVADVAQRAQCDLVRDAGRNEQRRRGLRRQRVAADRGADRA